MHFLFFDLPHESGICVLLFDLNAWFCPLIDVCLGMGSELMILMENGWMVVGIVSIVCTYCVGKMCSEIQFLSSSVNCRFTEIEFGLDKGMLEKHRKTDIG